MKNNFKVSFLLLYQFSNCRFYYLLVGFNLKHEMGQHRLE